MEKNVILKNKRRMGMTERRKYMRFDISVDLEYLVSGSSMPIEGISVTKDLSREGLKFILDKDLLPGTKLEIKLRIPGDAAPIYAKGAIVWVDKKETKGEPGVGLKFTQISPFDRNRILDYVYREWVEKKIKSQT